MATLTNAEKALILVDGESVTPEDAAVSSTANVIASTPVGADGFVYVQGNLAGVATINVTKDGRSGSVEVTVTDAPLAVTLGTPEPK